MQAFIEANRDVLILVSTGFGVAALVLCAVLIAQVAAIRKPFRSLAALQNDIGTEESLRLLLRGVDENREFIRGQAEQIKAILRLVDGCYSGMGLVRYNAFEDIGGNQSFSLCIVDRNRNGFMLTNLVGRNSTRGYAIEIKDGAPSRELSDEERESLGYALRSVEA